MRAVVEPHGLKWGVVGLQGTQKGRSKLKVGVLRSCGCALVPPAEAAAVAVAVAVA